MRLRIKIHPGTNDFPELKGNIPAIGEIRDFPDKLAERLLQKNVAEVVEVKGVAQPPTITAPLSESKPAPLTGKVKPSDKPSIKES